MADDTRDPLNDDELAAAFRSTRRASRTHLIEAEWERLACDEMTAAERDTALVHIMNCAECSTIHRSLMLLRDGATEIEAPPSLRFGETGSRSRSGRDSRRWAIPAALAAAAVIIVAVLIYRPARVEPDNVMRSATPAAVVTVLSPIANEPLIDRRFSWQGIAGATAYELRVSTQDGVRLFTSRRDETFAELPGEIELKDGTYYWRVLAFKGDTEIAASPLIPFISRGR